MPDEELSNPHAQSHGEKMGGETSMDASPPASVHCCACWKYTDNVSREKELIHAAVSIIANSGTLAVEKSAAFTAADEYLKAAFAFSLDVYRAASGPTMPRFG